MLEMYRSFSADEEYVACFLSCLVDATTKPEKISRSKIQRILSEKPLLHKRIEKQAKVLSNGVMQIEPESERLNGVIIKLARGHALHEIHELCMQSPSETSINTVNNFSSQEWHAFANPEALTLLPEVGSRAMQMLRVEDGTFYLDWIIAQKNTYSYYVSQNHAVEVRILLLNYLACYVRWDY